MCFHGLSWQENENLDENKLIVIKKMCLSLSWDRSYEYKLYFKASERRKHNGVMSGQ